ncbi:MAG: sugar phosphate nucleotidyltransferase [Armatimonadota bacterium]
MKPICALIPAGGRGTRLQPLTYAVPKELLPLGAYPTIQHVTDEVVAAGIRDIIVVTGAQKRLIEDHLDELKRRGETSANFLYVSQEEPRGLGDAVAAGRAAVNDRPFVVALGDGVIRSRQDESLLSRMIDIFDEKDAAAVIGVEQVVQEECRKYGICVPAEEDYSEEGPVRLCDLVEKPEPENAPSTLAICGRYIFKPVIFDYIAALTPGKGGEIQLTDAIADLARAGEPVYAVPLSGGEHRLDVGNLKTYYEAVAELAADV